MQNIVISNIYGPYNLGDQAIRHSALKLITEIYPQSKITLLTETITEFADEKFVATADAEFLYSPYGYVIHSDTDLPKSPFHKLLRFLTVLLGSLIAMIVAKFTQAPIFRNGFLNYVHKIQRADVVILMGGGYLVTRNRYRDLLGLILNVIPIGVASFLGKKIIILPISFGPFYSKLHQRIAGYFLAQCHVTCRDEISLSLAMKYNKTSQLFPDLALYEWSKPNKKIHENSDYFVLTIKDYYSLQQQVEIEKEFIKFVTYVWEHERLRCVFIPTATNPIEENDLPVGMRMEATLGNDYFSVKKCRSASEATNILAGAKFSVCTRMHSAIFSALSFTPFIAIAYEHKVSGLMKLLKLERWQIPMKSVRFANLRDMYLKLQEKQMFSAYRKQLLSDQKNIVTQRTLLQKYIVAIAKNTNYIQ